MAYVPNNIRFRSVSAKSIEHYYSTKSYILNELLMERNQFSEVARETLLLLFNSYSGFTTRIEYLFLNNSHLTAKEVEATLGEDDWIVSYHLDLFETYPELFADKFIEAWLTVNRHSREAFRTIIRGTENMTHMEAYPLIIAGLCAYLQNCMYELYEIDCLLGSNFIDQRVTPNRSNSDRIVMYVDNFALDYFYKTGIFMCEERLRYYTSLTQCSKLPTLVKNYSTFAVSFTGIIEGDEPLASLLKRCLEYVELINIEMPATDS